MTEVVRLQRLRKEDEPDLRSLVIAYWHELMPKANVIQDEQLQEQYYADRFPLQDNVHQCFFAILNGDRIGFVNMTIASNVHYARIRDFYILPEMRRQGNGSLLLQQVLRYLDKLGIEQIDLAVRRDNPVALSFWQAKGFGIATYNLRQYRDPKIGQAFEGTLSSDFDD